MNIVVKALLFGPKVSKVERKRQNEETIDAYIEAQTKRWRALGAVGKLHNITRYVRYNPQRRAYFLSQQLIEGDNPLMLKADNDTRWNSTWNMIDSALKQRDRVDAFVAVIPDLVNDALTYHDWEDLEEIMELLAPFKWLTMLGQERGSKLGSVGSILWGMDMLLTLLEDARKRSRPSDSAFQMALDHAWGLLDKYYKETDKSWVYVVSLILDPRMKYDYFERNWPKKWMEGVKKKMKIVFDEFRDSEEGMAAPPSLPQISTENTGIKKFDTNKWRFGNTMKREEELVRYLKAPLLVLDSQKANDEFDVLEWWKGNSREWPICACIAAAIYSIPAMSVEPERVFSGYLS